jgi:hypothetical protein
MPAKLKYELTATVGEYKNSEGETKKRYQRCGSVFENDQGHLSVKLDCLPVSKDWSGFFSCFEPKEQGRDRTPQDGYKQRSPLQGGYQGERATSNQDEEEDSIPF